MKWKRILTVEHIIWLWLSDTNTSIKIHLFLSLKVFIYLWGVASINECLRKYKVMNSVIIYVFHLRYVHLIYTKSCHWGSITESADQALVPFSMKEFISSNVIDTFQCFSYKLTPYRQTQLARTCFCIRTYIRIHSRVKSTTKWFV